MDVLRQERGRRDGSLVFGVVLLSAVLHWIAVHRIHGPWIVPDEVIYAARGYEFWHSGPWHLLHGPGTGYGLLYPLVVGVPLSVGRTTDAYSLLKIVQPVVASLAVVPVFVYGRRLMPVRWAIVSAVLTAASPFLLYSGFVMTEVLFYPLAALTLLMIARAVETSSVRDQVIALALVAAAVLTRSQAIALAIVLPFAATLDALMARDLRKLRAFWPSAIVLGVGLAVVALVPGLIGAYGGTLRGTYPFHPALDLVLDHLAYVALSVAVAPVAALVVLAVDGLRARERDPAARALIAVTAAATVVFVLQVGFFAARYSPHLLGRDLAALPPLLFLVFALWLSRGAPRTWIAASVGVYALLALLVLTPWDTLVVPVAFADTFDLIVVSKLPWSPATTLIVFSVVVLLAVLFLPRRIAALVLPAVVLATLVASSAVASPELARAAGDRRLDVIGPVPDWIDRAADADVAYVYGGEQLWTAVWQERFWNRSINQVITLGGTPVPGPLAQVMLKLGPNGELPTRDRYVVAPDRFTFVGARVAHLTQTGLDISGLTLWRLSGTPRVSTITNAVQPNGDMTRPATVSVYDCRSGELQLTLIPKATSRLLITLDGHRALDEAIAGDSWTGAVPVPHRAAPRVCQFTIYPEPLLGSTRIAFSRA